MWKARVDKHLHIVRNQEELHQEELHLLTCEEIYKPHETPGYSKLSTFFWDNQTDSPTKITEYMSVIVLIWWMFWFIMAICACFDSLANVPVPYSIMGIVAFFYLIKV